MNSCLSLTSCSPGETQAIAEDIGKKARPGDIIALHGDLGAGKTVMAKGIAKGLGIKDDVTSPTFTLMETYKGRLALHHFDLYRINSADEFDNLFFEEYWDGNGVSVIEWPEKAGDRLPPWTIRVRITSIDDCHRSITIEYPGD